MCHLFCDCSSLSLTHSDVRRQVEKGGVGRTERGEKKEGTLAAMEGHAAN